MKNIKVIVSLAMAVLFSLGITMTAVASDPKVIQSITNAAEAAADCARESAVKAVKEQAGGAMVDVMDEEKKKEAKDDDKKDETEK
ncbi:MAG: hypothetical protein WGN25_08385 [Candidatus Electrothrix sp. GW3-4]|uniref:hypothetical protein n=1 Tax=Candidatus Electrothrix sp. GW3-4 TaxID=3126740 RepID=UPI0030D0A8CF